MASATCRTGLLLLLALGLAACSGTREFKESEQFDRREPLRIAVLPFIDSSEGDSVLASPVASVMDILPILSDDSLTKEHAANIFRQQFTTNLQQTDLELIPPVVVDGLVASSEVDLLAEYQKPRSEAAASLCDLLGADAVVFGDVFEWDRDYYVLESMTWGGLAIDLVRHDGETLFSARVSDYETRGILNLPITDSASGAAMGIFGNALKGLSNTVFAIVSHNVSRQIVDGLAPVENVSDTPPQVTLAAHSALAPLRIGDELQVVALGAPDARVTFRIGRDHAPVLMHEISPGSYFGSLQITPAHWFRQAKVSVRFVNRDLRATTLKLQHPRVSTELPAP